MLNNDDIKFIDNVLPFYGFINETDQQDIIMTASKASYKPMDMILSRKKKCNGLVIVKSGQLRAYFETEDGREITLYRLFSSDVCILTASCVMKNINFEVTLEVENKSEVYFIPAATWGNLAKKYSKVKEFSMELMSERFSEVMWVMEQMVSKNMGQRIAAFLLEQSELEKSATIAMTHEMIAKNIGTAREVISRTLKYFENDGILKLSRGQIKILDLKKLKDICR